MQKLQVGIQALKYGLSNCQVKVTHTNASFPAFITWAYLEFGETASARLEISIKMLDAKFLMTTSTLI